jgi:two-component system, response regulator YesN
MTGETIVETYRMIIVDDEQVIRNGLKSVVDWAELGYEIAGAFASASEALAWLAKHPADVLLADICMPGTDGLELIRRAKAVRNDLVAVILSGYDNFEFARAAIDCGVFGYLLKPVREEQVEELFCRLKNLLDERAQQRVNSSIIIESDAVRQLNLLLRHSAIDPSGLQRLLTAFPSLNNFGKARVLLLEVLPSEQYHDRDSVEQVTVSVLQEITTRLCGTFPIIRLADRPAFAVVITGSELGTLDSARESFVLISDLVARRSGLRLSGSVGCAVERIDALHIALKSAETVLNRRRYEGIGHLIEYDGTRVEHSPDDSYIFDNSDLGVVFVRAVVEGDRMAVQDTARQLFGRLIDARVGDTRLAETWVRAFIDRVATQLRSWGVSVELVRKHLYAGLDKSLTMPTYAIAADVLAEAFTTFLDCAGAFRSDPCNATIIDAVDFIRTNLANDVSLEQLADRAKMSPSYFSRLFKHVVGENFKDYLIARRLEFAKQRLRDSSDKVYAVAEAAGFRDHHYFSDVFKRKTGVTPLEYRHRSKTTAS